METQLLDTDNRISELVDKYSDMVLRLAITYVKNIHDAQDICQNVFVKVFKQNSTSIYLTDIFLYVKLTSRYIL